MEPNSPKKIQFAVPLFQSHLDPQAAEHVSRDRDSVVALVINVLLALFLMLPNEKFVQALIKCLINADNDGGCF